LEQLDKPLNGSLRMAVQLVEYAVNHAIIQLDEEFSYKVRLKRMIM
jgi:hypothetical protein